MSHVGFLPRRRNRHRSDSSAAGFGRLVAVASAAVAIQASVVEPSANVGVRSLDLPLAVATVLIVARPDRSATISLVCGLLVDAFGRRLFGIHLVAFAVIGPVLQIVPVSSRLPPRLALGIAGAIAAVFATLVVVAGQTMADGGLPAGLVGRLSGAAAGTALIVVTLAGSSAGRLDPLAR